MSDLISRQSAIDAITDESIVANMDSVFDTELHKCKRAMQRILASLPSAQPEREKGKWVYLGYMKIGFHCSVCGGYAISGKDNFCSHCGAEMRGEVNE